MWIEYVNIILFCFVICYVYILYNLIWFNIKATEFKYVVPEYLMDAVCRVVCNEMYTQKKYTRPTIRHYLFEQFSCSDCYLTVYLFCLLLLCVCLFMEEFLSDGFL